jgi:Ni/Fe-hydrogenase 1 B-type cytochrome subunit
MEKEIGSFRGKHSRSLRIWHWATFLLFLGSLTTVLLAKTLLNTRKNIPLVQENLQENNILVTAGQAKSLAHEFNDLAWHWHIYFGYVLAGLFGFRLLFEFFQPSDQKVIPVLKNTLHSLRRPGPGLKEIKYYLFVRCAYLLFYTALAVQVISGLFMAYSDDVPELKNLRHTVSDVHAFCMWVLISYSVIHIIGVVIAEQGKKNRGIVSNMINGGGED